MYETMNIYSKPWTKIKVTEQSINNGWESSKKWLKVWKTYTVKRIIVWAWSSEVQLEEFNWYYNTVLFEDIISNNL